MTLREFLLPRPDQFAGDASSAVRPCDAGRLAQVSWTEKATMMTITIGNALLRALALGVAVVGGDIAADASFRLPAEQMSEMPSLAPLLKEVTTSVVTIAVASRPGSQRNSSLNDGRRARRLGNTRDLAVEHRIKASGSGVVIDAQQGLILTNNHVITRAEEIIVNLADGRQMQAMRIGSDPATDVALVKVPAQDLVSVKMGDSDELEVGDFVLAIGNPFRIGQTVTSGIISGLHRTNIGIEEYEDFIQTDAAIYPGNSGGALVNLRGELIGINTGFIGAANTNPGMGFAIPINTARFVADQLLKYGEVRRAAISLYADETPAIEQVRSKRYLPRTHNRPTPPRSVMPF